MVVMLLTTARQATFKLEDLEYRPGYYWLLQGLDYMVDATDVSGPARLDN